MGDPSLAVRDRRSRSRAARVPNDAFTLAVQCGGCGMSVVRQRPRARFRRAALASVALRPHGQRECASPAPLATPRATARRLHEIPGGSPVAAWPQESTRQPPRRLLSEPPSVSMWPQRAFGRASARMTSRLNAIRHWIAPFGAHVGFSRPRCLWQLYGWRHPTTPSREPHERSSYHDPCRHWPGGRFCRLSLPLCPIRTPSPDG